MELGQGLAAWPRAAGRGGPQLFVGCAGVRRELRGGGAEALGEVGSHGRQQDPGKVRPRGRARAQAASLKNVATGDENRGGGAGEQCLRLLG